MIEIKVLIAFLLFILVACGHDNANQTVQQLDFKAFTIETPHTWKQITLTSIDSYAGGIAIDERDTIYFDLGFYSNDLTEYMELIMEDGKTYYISAYDTGYFPTLYDSTNKSKVVKSSITREWIDGRNAKVLTPIESGIGTTGFYIDSLGIDSTNFHKFNFYGTNLKPQNEVAALAVLRTIKFKN